MNNEHNEEENNPYYDAGYSAPQEKNIENLWNEHLDTTVIISYIENMLMGKELNDKGEWINSTIEVYDNEGNVMEINEGPLMNKTEVRIIMTWLRSLLNSNTFLSKLSSEQINNISFEVVWILEKVFYKLRFKLPAHIRSVLSNLIENSIFIGLNRAGEGRRGMTLDAVSGSHQTIEHLQGRLNQREREEEKKFKVFGF